MDNNEDENDIQQTPSGSRGTINEETGENEQDTYQQNRQQYRNNELFASDEESDESSESSDESKTQRSLPNLDHASYNRSFDEHLNLIPSVSDCGEKLATFRPLNESINSDNYCPNRYDRFLLEDDFIRTLDETCVISESSKCPSSIENDSEKVIMSPDLADVSDCSSSKENKKSCIRVKKLKSFNSEHSDSNINLKSSSERSGISPMLPQHILISRYPNFGSDPISTEISPSKSCRSSNVGIYGMISSPITSNYTNLQSTQLSQDPLSSNTLHSPTAENSENSKNLRKLFTRSCEYPATSSRNISCTKKGPHLNACTTPNSSNINTDESVPAPNSKIHRGQFSSSWDLPRTLDFKFCSTEERRQLTVGPFSSSNIRNGSASFMSDISDTSTLTGQHSPKDNFPKPNPKFARKLVFDESDTSSGDTKEIIPIKKEPRKRKKTKRSQLSDSSENRSTFPKMDESDENVSENEHSSPSSSENSKRKTLKLDETPSPSNTLRSLKIKKSEKDETQHSSRKRLISVGKASSDIEKSDIENKRSKKLKQCASSD